MAQKLPQIIKIIPLISPYHTNPRKVVSFTILPMWFFSLKISKSDFLACWSKIECAATWKYTNIHTLKYFHLPKGMSVGLKIWELWKLFAILPFSLHLQQTNLCSQITEGTHVVLWRKWMVFEIGLFDSLVTRNVININ